MVRWWSFVIVLAIAWGGAWCEGQELPPAAAVLNATYKIQHESSTATGFLLEAPEGGSKGCLLITAAHVLEQLRGDQCTLVLRQAGGDETYTRRDHPVTVRKEDQPLWTKHAEQDVAALRITLPEDATARPLPLSVLADDAALKGANVQIGERLLTFGYPVRFETNAAGFPVARHASIASAPIVPAAKNFKVLLDMSAFAGDSGGPILLVPFQAATEPPATRLFGLIIGKVQHDERVQMLFEERTVHHSLGLAVAVQAQAIRETIALLPPP